MSEEFACAEPCPTPCRITIPDAKAAFALSYDNGRFARSVVTSQLGTETFEACDYDGATLVACTTDGNRRAPIHRDARGKIIEIGNDPNRQYEVEYDARGDAVSVAWADQGIDAALSYDRDHHMIAERYRAGSLNDVAIDYTYDARGNVVTITSTNHALTGASTAIHFVYDAANRRTHANSDANDQGASTAIAFEYDAHGRLVRTIEANRTADHEESHDVSYAYDCSAPRCSIHIAASGISVNGTPATRNQAVALCARTSGADVLVAADAKVRDWDELREALEAALVPIFRHR